MSKNNEHKSLIWALVPAAGIGARMSVGQPKQYLTVSGKTVLEHSLSTLLEFKKIKAVQLCIASDDQYWAELGFDHDKLLPVQLGGAQRANTVLAGLNALSNLADPRDWVMVHDAARPCTTNSLLTKLVDAVEGHDIGGILATPLSDTIKKVNSNIIEKTVDRQNLWSAQTPQMFRYGVLRDCMEQANEKGLVITDEASAIEAAGYQSLIVPSDRSNIKLTYTEDLDWINYFLSKQ